MRLRDGIARPGVAVLGRRPDVNEASAGPVQRRCEPGRPRDVGVGELVGRPAQQPTGVHNGHGPDGLDRIQHDGPRPVVAGEQARVRRQVEHRDLGTADEPTGHRRTDEPGTKYDDAGHVARIRSNNAQ